EKVLHDVRETIAELINDVFYSTLNKLAHEKGCSLTAESVAPTMVSDGMLHYKNADIPMGEFWLNSPTHDKPNDMHDAISGAHIYGKNIVQAEAFTTVRMDWSEYPGTLKTLGDRNFASGANKMVIHVFTHNPWMDKKPGMTLDGVGLYYQRDQTWFKQSKVWIDYLSQCQAILQSGKPVVDIAVFTGEEVPRRSVLPDRLVYTLPGIFGDEKVAEEKTRLENKGQPLRQIPDGVTNSANIADPEKWIDPLNGYSYDSFNPDALMMMTVKNGRVTLPGGADYGVLVFPDHNSMNPNDGLISLPVANKILELLKAGAKIIISKDYMAGEGLKDDDEAVRSVIKEIIGFNKKGRLLFTPFTNADFSKLGIEKDLDIENNSHALAWTHRKMGSMDIYFLSNQTDTAQLYRLRFRDHSKYAQLIYPGSSSIAELPVGKSGSFTGSLPAAASMFYVFTNESYADKKYGSGDLNELDLSGNKWKIQFDKNYGGPEAPIETNELKSWTKFSDSSVMYYSGTAVYSTKFDFKGDVQSAGIQIDSVYGMATVKVNGIDCGTIWYGSGGDVNISKALKKGTNILQIEVSNTWHNRLIRDEMLPVDKRITWTTAPFRLKNKPLLPAGIEGSVKISWRN
ncbi:MAG: DNA-binding protein, partial [Bacteroidetes bacterium]|nr:DNA-binding protein [Bacteroidota bacterium]